MIRSRRRRGTGPAHFADRIETITTPRERPDIAALAAIGVLPPGTSRYQRLSAHLPSGVARFRGLGVVPTAMAIDLHGDDASLDLS